MFIGSKSNGVSVQYVELLYDPDIQRITPFPLSRERHKTVSDNEPNILAKDLFTNENNHDKFAIKGK